MLNLHWDMHLSATTTPKHFHQNNLSADNCIHIAYHYPRNKYSNYPLDFSVLASLYPSFQSYVFYSREGKPRIDWKDFNATRELTRVLLLHDHSITWWIPDGQLCPTIPNRSNYIHWTEDLLCHKRF